MELFAAHGNVVDIHIFVDDGSTGARSYYDFGLRTPRVGW